MGWVIGLFAATLVLMGAFVANTVRADNRAGTTTEPGWSGWLLIVLAFGCVIVACALFWRRVFSG